jgi:hypothetical protein
MYGANIDEVFAQAEKEYQRVKSRAEQNKQVRMKSKRQKSTSGSNFSSSTHTLLLVLIAIGTLINAILLSFLLIEVKKNAG